MAVDKKTPTKSLTATQTPAAPSAKKNAADTLEETEQQAAPAQNDENEEKSSKAKSRLSNPFDFSGIFEAGFQTNLSDKMGETLGDLMKMMFLGRRRDVDASASSGPAPKEEDAETDEKKRHRTKEEKERLKEEAEKNTEERVAKEKSLTEKEPHGEPKPNAPKTKSESALEAEEAVEKAAGKVAKDETALAAKTGRAVSEAEHGAIAAKSLGRMLGHGGRFVVALAAVSFVGGFLYRKAMNAVLGQKDASNLAAAKNGASMALEVGKQAALSLIPGYSTYQALKAGDWKSAALWGAVDLVTVGTIFFPPAAMALRAVAAGRALQMGAKSLAVVNGVARGMEATHAVLTMGKGSLTVGRAVVGAGVATAAVDMGTEVVHAARDPMVQAAAGVVAAGTVKTLTQGGDLASNIMSEAMPSAGPSKRTEKTDKEDGPSHVDEKGPMRVASNNQGPQGGNGSVSRQVLKQTQANNLITPSGGTAGRVPDGARHVAASQMGNYTDPHHSPDLRRLPQDHSVMTRATTAAETLRKQQKVRSGMTALMLPGGMGGPRNAAT